MDASGEDGTKDGGLDAVPLSDGFADGPPPTIVAGGSSLCATAGLLFCDGFENGPGAWKPVTTGGSVALDGSRAFRGAHSLHARTNAVPGQNLPQLYAHFDQTFAQALPRPLFVRMFVYLPSPVPPSVGAFIDVVENAAPFPGVQLDFRPPTGLLGGMGYNGLDTDWSSSTDLLPADSSACIEMEIDGPPSNIVHVFLSGAELPAMQHALPVDVPPLAVLRVGLGYYQAMSQPESDLWIDEIAADGARIGCTR